MARGSGSTKDAHGAPDAGRNIRRTLAEGSARRGTEGPATPSLTDAPSAETRLEMGLQREEKRRDQGREEKHGREPILVSSLHDKPMEWEVKLEKPWSSSRRFFVSETSADLPDCLPQSVFVLDQGQTQVAFAGFAETATGADSHF